MVPTATSPVPLAAAPVAARPDGGSTALLGYTAPLALPAPAKPAEAQAPERLLERAIDQAARAMFPDRAVEVSTFYDEGSGHYVHRVADSQSGQVLVQSPSEELLRFYQGVREGRPLMALTV